MNTLLARLCTLLALAQMAFAAPGLVLCIEPCGEVNIEAAAAGGCTDCPEGKAPARDAQAPAPGTTATEGPACPCVDVALDPPAAGRSKDLAADVGAQTLALEVVSAPQAPAAADARAQARSAPRPGELALVLVGTIVLRV